jgi:hypothetical protein
MEKEIKATVKKPKSISVKLSGNNTPTTSINIKNVPTIPRSESLDGGSF